MRVRRLRGLVALLLAVALVGCGGAESTDTSASSSSSETDTAHTASSGEVDRTVTLQPNGNELTYKQTTFTVAPGETVRLVFDNVATSLSMRHNVVLLTSNEDDLVQAIGQAGTRAGATNDYIPQDDELRRQVLAYTPISKPGETVAVTFTVPDEPGEHGYLCTFPGHWATMQGTMIVKEEAAA